MNSVLDFKNSDLLFLANLNLTEVRI